MSNSTAVAVFGSSLTNADSPAWAEAEVVGRTLSEAGVVVITGGYGGTMEAVSKGAASVNGHVVGVTAPALFPGRHGANRYVSELVEADDLAHRIGIMMDRASGTLALPGSIGTATELLVAWNMNHIVRRNGGRRLPTVAIGPAWSSVAETLVGQVGAFPGDIELAPTTREGLDWILRELKMP